MSAHTAAEDVLIGSRIDSRYLVVRVLGSGGMGTVYEGLHERLGRRVAIKVLQRGLGADATAFERFLREARIASGLGHGNIVDVSDLGQLPDGRPFLIMPKIEGIDLAMMLRRDGPMPGPRVVQLLAGVAAALDLVHAKGLVHRDVKPENLMHVEREDGSESVMLLDFGIATLVGPDVARLTAAGRILGTPAYLSPEAIRGGSPNRSGDVYALATVAYELMCGCLPFESENPTQVMTQKLSYAAPGMGDQSGREFPAPIEAVMARGLTRDPDQRYASAGDLIAALQAAIYECAGFDWEAGSWVDPRAAETSNLPRRSRELSLSGSDAFTQPKVVAPQPISAELEAPLRRGRSRIVLVLSIVALLSAIAGVFAASSLPSPPASDRNEQPPTSQHTAALPAEPKPPPPAPAQPDPLAAGVPAPTEMPALTPVPASEKTRAPKRGPRANPAPAPAPFAPPAVVPVPAPSIAPGLSASDLNRLAASELVQGHLARAAEMYTRATKVSPNDPAGWRGLGVCNERLGRSADAIRSYERALALSPNGSQAESMRTRLQQLRAAH